MKRTIVLLALVTAFVLAFTAVAQATWRGFTPIRTQAEVDAGRLQGFIGWDEARNEMIRNNVGAINPILQSTVHGGYVTTTTKCVVCHSAHRASGVWNPTPTPAQIADENINPTNPAATNPFLAGSNINQFFLTAGQGNSCESCHVTTGPGASVLLVEWGPLQANGDVGGPHAAPRRGCVMCHNTGIHGLGNSDFHVLNVFMLGNQRRSIPGGATRPDGTPTRDTLIAEWMNLEQDAAGDWVQIDDTTNPFVRNNQLDNPGVDPATTSWWADGLTGITEIGGIPAGLDSRTYGAARSLATAVTCGEGGCHATGMFFNLNWGTAINRLDRVNTNAGYVPVDPDDPSTWTQAPGSPTAPAGISNPPLGLTPVTGHIMPSIRSTGGPGNNQNACGPCHGGNVAGFPTASRTANVPDWSRRAYGCDQCHDMLGVATNSTAWPHGNRNIQVYEWDATGAQQITTAGAGNLWMYAGNIARAASASMGDRGTAGGNVPVVRAGNMGPSAPDPIFADQRWFVMTGVTSGRYGMALNAAGNVMPGVSPTYEAFATNNPGISPTVTGLIDGSCLKCHVALDNVSFANTPVPSMGADALAHSWGRFNTGTGENYSTHAPHAGEGTPLNPEWTGVQAIGSGRLFLYR